jgi:hypothetical protein
MRLAARTAAAGPWNGSRPSLHAPFVRVQASRRPESHGFWAGKRHTEGKMDLTPHVLQLKTYRNFNVRPSAPNPGRCFSACPRTLQYQGTLLLV